MSGEADGPEDEEELEAAAADFTARLHRGENPDPAEYAARHPRLAAEIRATFPALAAMEGAALPRAGEGPGTGGDLACPTQIGPYRILGLLGRGGQAEVFLAEDPRLGRRVALKVLRAPDALRGPALGRFRREAEIAARVDHPGICPIYDAGEVEGSFYIAMRYLEGRTLAQRLLAAEGPPGTREEVLSAARLIESAARALHAAHEAGLVHRDIKPGNLMVTPEGEPVVLDFGLAREEEGGGASLTQSGGLLGTPAYMAPEQLAGERTSLDRRADVYALGATLFQCLTLHLPHEAPTREGLYREILSGRVCPARDLNPAVPRDLSTVVETAIETDPDRRYRTALDLAEDLRRVREREPILARPAGPLLRARRWAERNPALAASIAGTFVALAAGLATTGILLVRADESEARALASEERARASERSTRALALVAESRFEEPADPMLALLLARKAARLDGRSLVLTRLHEALRASPLRAVLRLPRGTIVSARFTAAGDGVDTVGDDGSRREWDLLGREVPRRDTPGGSGTAPPRVEGDGRRLELRADGTLHLLGPGAQDSDLPGDGAVVCFFGFFSPGGWVLAGYKDGTARVFDSKGGRVGPVLRGPEGAVLSVELSPRRDRVLTVSADGTARIWDPSGEEFTLVPLGVKVRAAAFEGADDRVRTRGDDGCERLFDPERDEWAVPLPRDGAGRRSSSSAVRLPGEPLEVRSSSGAWIATGGTDRIVLLQDSARGVQYPLRGHLGAIECLAFSPDDSMLLSCCSIGTTRIWDPATRKELAVMRAGQKPITDASFSRSGRMVLTQDKDRVARLWYIRADDLLALAGRRILRGFTAEERLHYEGRLEVEDSAPR